MFASMVVVLPSPFKGGDVHLSHAGLSSVIDCAAGSLLRTSIFACYTEVTQEMKPVSSGYWLALAYNLVHTTNAPRPSPPSKYSAVEKLCRVLLSWKQRKEAIPLKVIYLLDDAYPQDNLKGDVLKGKDAQKVAILDLLAQELDFRLTLASIESHVTGPGDRDGMTDVSDRTVRVKSLVDLDGRCIRKTFDFEKDEEEKGHDTIPEELVDVLE